MTREATRKFAPGSWRGIVVYSIVILFLFFVLEPWVAMLFWNIPGSPVHLSKLDAAAAEPSLAQFSSLMLFMELVVRTIPYMLCGIVAFILLRNPAYIVPMILLFCVSHWYRPAVQGRLTFDYLRMGAFALGAMIGCLSLRLLQMRSVPKQQSSV